MQIMQISPMMSQAQGLPSNSNMSRTQSQSFGERHIDGGNFIKYFRSTEGCEVVSHLSSDLDKIDKLERKNEKSIMQNAELKKVIGKLINLVKGDPDKKVELAAVIEQYKGIFKI